MNCKTCKKNIDHIYYITKKPYCSKECEDKDENKAPDLFNQFFN